MYNRKWGCRAKCKVIAPNLVLRQYEGSELSIPHLTVILIRYMAFSTLQYIEQYSGYFCLLL